MALKRGDAHLEISNTEKDGTVRIEGARIYVIFSWMQLTILSSHSVFTIILRQQERKKSSCRKWQLLYKLEVVSILLFYLLYRLLTI